MKLSSLDLHYVLDELQFLVGAKVEKIFQDKEVFLLSLHVSGKGKQLLYISIPDVLCLSTFKPVFPDRPPGLCMQLRKRLSNARITEIKQVGFERIVHIVFSTKTESLTFIIELISPGNVYLVNESNKILAVAHPKKFADRSVLPGKPYMPPPPIKNIFTFTDEELINLLVSSKRDSIVKTLAVDCNLGGSYAEEVLIVAGIDKNLPSLDKNQLSNLILALRKMYSSPVQANVTNNAAFPFLFKDISSIKQFATFNEAIAEVVLAGIEASDQVQSTKKSAQTKINRVLAAQSKQLTSLGESERLNQQKGEYIYEHYTEIKSLLEKVNELRKQNRWDEIELLVKKLDKKQGTITIDVL